MNKSLNGESVTMTEDEQTTLEAFRADFQAQIDAIQYKFERQKAYASIESQLDMMYRDIENDTLDTTGEFYLHRKGVKDNNPKPA